MTANVLHLIGSFHEGGSERQAIQLARLLKEHGKYNVEVACLDATGVLRDEVDRLGFGEIRAFPLTSFYDGNAVKQLLRFALFLREREIAVVHTHDFYTNVFGMAAAALARVPARIASRRETAGWRTVAQRIVERRAYALCHTVVANADAVRAQLITEGVAEDKIVTIHNGLDLERFGSTIARDEALAMFNLPRGENYPVVTLVANLRHKVKIHSMFLRAARSVIQSIPRARFVIAGEGELTTPLRRQAEELGLGDNVFFIGRCGRIAELLALSDVCVLSSTAEGFSNAILEYMAARRPVVATDVGGAREVIFDGESGYLVPSDNHEAMAKRIVTLLQDPHRARVMGHRGRHIVEEKFSCDVQLEKTQQLYDQMLDRERPKLGQKARAADRASLHMGDPVSPPQIPGSTHHPGDPIRTPGATGFATTESGRAKPLRVLIVAPSLDILGGQAVQAARLLARLKEEPSIDVSFLPVNPRLPGPLRKLQAIKYVRTIVTSLLYWALLLARVRNYDVIHVFSASYFSFVLAPTPAILVAKLYGKRIVLNYRSGQAEDHLERWRRTALPTIRLVDEIAVPSNYLVEVFARFEFVARPIFNFVETERFCFRERRNLRPVFLSNRNLEPLYNVGCVLRAFAIIQQRFPEARLVVAGDGSQRAELETLARELTLRNVEFIGRVAPDRMHQLAGAADIYLNGSNIDNMPGSIIEAFASGLPVVTTDAGGIPYIVSNEETGLLVHRGDFEAMAAAALRLLEDNAFAWRLASRAREQCDKYRWVAVKSDWVQLYHEVGRKRAGMPTNLQPAAK
jgi:glycosyltransferase involved in cell wall biosynthesis